MLREGFAQSRRQAREEDQSFLLQRLVRGLQRKLEHCLDSLDQLLAILHDELLAFFFGLG